MITTLWVVAGLTGLFFLAFGIEAAVGGLSIRDLATVPPDGEGWPSLSVVIAARNEEKNVEEALSSVMAMDYPALEVIVVNDRSTDGTGEVLRRMAGRDSRLRVVEIDALPRGWLGKNHALHQAAMASRGEWILFTDADVVFEPSVARRAISYALGQHLDHLTAAAWVTGPTLPVRIFISAFAFFFLVYSRPWRARSASARFYVGIGAFNLVRASLYRKAGGHRPIAMRTDDDMRLAELLKRSGGRQDIVSARSLLRVEWYPSVRDAIAGLEKNGFAGVNYRVGELIGATVALLTICVWPWVAIFVAEGNLRFAYIAIVAFTVILVGSASARSGGSALHALAFPLATLAFAWAIWMSAIKALVRGGVEWRGTVYPLAELRRGGHPDDPTDAG